MAQIPLAYIPSTSLSWPTPMASRVVPYEWVKNKIFVSHVNVHQRVTPAENFNYQVNRMTHSVDTCQLLPSDNFVMAMMTEMEVSPGFSDMDFHSPNPHGYATVRCPISQHQTSTLSSQCGTILWLGQPDIDIDYTESLLGRSSILLLMK